jgi:hypothetical protein
MRNGFRQQERIKVPQHAETYKTTKFAVFVKMHRLHRHMPMSFHGWFYTNS